MSEREKTNLDDSSPSVTLTVGQLKTLMREEIEKVVGQNGHQNSKLKEAATPYLTIKEAAKQSRLGESTIRLHIRRRELKAHQVGSRVIIKRTDLEQFLEAHPIEITPI